MLVLRWSPVLRLCEDPAVGICDLNDEYIERENGLIILSNFRKIIIIYCTITNYSNIEIVTILKLKGWFTQK